MKRIAARADAEAARAEVDRKRGFPRVHPESEVQRFGVGIHVDSIVTTSAVAIDGDGDEVTLTIEASDERHLQPERRERIRAAKEPVEAQRDPTERPLKKR